MEPPAPPRPAGRSVARLVRRRRLGDQALERPAGDAGGAGAVPAGAPAGAGAARRGLAGGGAAGGRALPDPLRASGDPGRLPDLLPAWPGWWRRSATATSRATGWLRAAGLLFGLGLASKWSALFSMAFALGLVALDAWREGAAPSRRSSPRWRLRRWRPWWSSR